ncbi:PPE family protein [Mycobacterium tuberculosis str. Beijing/NITR203]|nr:PPE family protein [Mycobacterium tuberculosis str. Beijing/NITR203]
MNFAVLPPEVNSARIFAGAGLGPMLAAASAWDGLAEELHAAAGSFASVTTGLAGDAWHGPASLAMTRAASPYVGWLNTAAGQAAQAAGQARLAASAFEARWRPPCLQRWSRPTGHGWRRWWQPTCWARTPRRSRPRRLNTSRYGPRTWPRCSAITPPRRRWPRSWRLFKRVCSSSCKTCWPSWLAGTWAAEMWASATSATTTLATQTSASEIEATPTSASGISATETSALGTPAIGISASASPATDKSASASLPTPTSWWWATAARE